MANLTANEQLLQAWKDSGLTLDEVIRRSGLKITKASLSRKLRGEQVFDMKEVEAVASVFSKTVTLGEEATIPDLAAPDTAAG